MGPLRRHIALPADLASVTDVSAREIDPRDVGMSRGGVGAIWGAVETLYRTRTQPAIALCIRKRGQVVIERAIGHLRGNGPDDGPSTPRVAIRHGSPFCVFSVSKAITAMIVHLLDDRGLLHIDDPVVEYIPEFGKNGKERTSIRHVLTHRAGIPSVAGSANDAELLLHQDRVLELLCDARPVWEPGRRLGYHAVTGGFVLGEIVKRVSGRDVRQWLEEEVSRPLGLEWLGYGVKPERIHEVAKNELTGAPVPPGLATMVKRALGVNMAQAVEISNDPRWLSVIVPSGNVVANAYEAATFFDLLRMGGALDDVRVFSPRTVRRALTESSYLEVDLTLAFPVRYGLGLMLGGPKISLFGPRTPNAFGHLGFINVLCWADPDRELSAALLTSGKPFVGRHLLALTDVLRAISMHAQ